ncbi:MAG: transglutaminase family protein [Nitrospirota bacterium]|nr:transglutaminase family protein [Nitrospirota bacterium]
MPLSACYLFKSTTRLTIAAPAREHHFLLRILPKSMPCMILSEWELSIEAADYVSAFEDAFGNRVFYGAVLGEHAQLVASVWGKVLLRDEYWDDDLQGLGLFCLPSPMVGPSEALDGLVAAMTPAFRKLQTREGMLFLNDAVFRQLVYEKCVTNSETDAGEALSRGKGVCQDFAHILIGLLRGLGMPARYVTGYIEGEGDSHAWVEAFHEGRWYGLDPTHNTLVREGYIKVAHGRDAKDTRMNSGVFKGKFSQYVEVNVRVEMLETDDARDLVHA